MKILKEITVWDSPIPNHTYAVNRAGKLMAYRKQGETEWIVFPKAHMNFVTTRRKFETLLKHDGEIPEDFFENINLPV